MKHSCDDGNIQNKYHIWALICFPYIWTGIGYIHTHTHTFVHMHVSKKKPQFCVPFCNGSNSRLCAFNRVQTPLKVKAHKVNILGLKRPTNTSKCGKGVYFVCASSSSSVSVMLLMLCVKFCIDRTFFYGLVM